MLGDISGCPVGRGQEAAKNDSSAEVKKSYTSLDYQKTGTVHYLQHCAQPYPQAHSGHSNMVQMVAHVHENSCQCEFLKHCFLYDTL